MTDLRDRPLPSGAVYHVRKGRLEIMARVEADSILIEAKTDSLLRRVERQIITQTDVVHASKAETKALHERRRPPPIWEWLGYLPYILMVALGLWVYRYLYRNK